MSKFNYATLFFDTNAVVAAEARSPNADFRNGMNGAASCAPGIGFASGELNFKEQDYPIPATNVIQRSSYIGWQDVEGVIAPTAITAGAPTSGAGPTSGRGETPAGSNALITPVLAAGAVVDGGDVETVGGFIFTNQTGETLQAGDRVFGVAANP